MLVSQWTAWLVATGKLTRFRAGLYGRRPIYLVSLPIFTLGSMGVALSNSLAALIATRILAGIGSSAVLSVGAGELDSRLSFPISDE